MSVSGTPSSSTWPAVGWYMPVSSFTRVVLPAPFSPTRATDAPAGRCASTRSSTVLPSGG